MVLVLPDSSWQVDHSAGPELCSWVRDLRVYDQQGDLWRMVGGSN